jgi:hypothetical protein
MRIKAFGKWVLTSFIPWALVPLATFYIGTHIGKARAWDELKAIMERREPSQGDRNPEGGDGTAPSRSDESAGPAKQDAPETPTIDPTEAEQAA